MRVTRFLMVCLTAAASSLVAGNASAAVIAYTGTGAAAGTNTGNLNIGRHFSVSGTGITVRDLGVFDAGNDGLQASHLVTLYKIDSGAGAAGASVTPVNNGSVTVPAGTAAPAETSIRFATLPSPIFLTAGNYSVVAYGMNVGTADAFGNGGGFPGNGNVTDIRFDPFQFVTTPTTAYPANGDINNHSSASFRYDLGNTTPEPGCLGAIGLGLIALTARRRKCCDA